MNIREQLNKTRYGPICNFGGDSEQKTVSTSNNYDQRSIVTQTLDGGAIADAFGFAASLGGGALGMASTVAGAAMAGNKALASQSIDASTAATAHAYDYADNIFSGALGFAAQNAAGTNSAYDHAAQVQADAYSGALGFAGASAARMQSAFDSATSAEAGAMGSLQSAYADAKGTSAANQKIMLAVIAVAGIAVLMKAK